MRRDPLIGARAWPSPSLQESFTLSLPQGAATPAGESVYFPSRDSEGQRFLVQLAPGNGSSDTAISLWGLSGFVTLVDRAGVVRVDNYPLALLRSWPFAPNGWFARVFGDVPVWWERSFYRVMDPATVGAVSITLVASYR